MVRFSTFIEGEVRSFAPALSMLDAVSRVRNGSVDGLTVDVINEQGDICVSHEVQAGRPIVSWYDYECR